jgi:DNA-binding transcriptional LysR family regulator
MKPLSLRCGASTIRCMDKLKQIESFVLVAAKGSLTAAAQAEGVAPAVMGRRLDALEARLGVKLMLRTTRRLTLTPEGQAFLEDCQRLIASLASRPAAICASRPRPASAAAMSRPWCRVSWPSTPISACR